MLDRWRDWAESDSARLELNLEQLRDAPRRTDRGSYLGLFFVCAVLAPIGWFMPVPFLGPLLALAAFTFFVLWLSAGDRVRAAQALSQPSDPQVETDVAGLTRAQALRELAQLRAEGLITEEEFAEERKRLG